MYSARTRTANRRSGFTLVEAVIVIVVVAILVAITVELYETVSPRAKVAQVKSDMETIARAIEAYTVDFGEPPIAPKNEPWDTTAGVWKRVTGPTKSFTPLTTPTAYIRSIGLINPFIDHGKSGFVGQSYFWDYLLINFKTGITALNSLTWCGEPQTPDLNWFWPGQGSALAVKTPSPNTMTLPVQYCFNGNKSRKYPATWVLIATGPSDESNEIRDATGKLSFTWEIWVDGDTQAWKCYTEDASGSFYDASNGTRSLGHFWRFSSGAMK